MCLCVCGGGGGGAPKTPPSIFFKKTIVFSDEENPHALNSTFPRLMPEVSQLTSGLCASLFEGHCQSRAVPLVKAKVVGRDRIVAEQASDHPVEPCTELVLAVHNG